MPDLTSRLIWHPLHQKACLKTLLIFSRSIVPRSLGLAFPLSSRWLPPSLRDLFLALSVIDFSLSSRSLSRSLRDRSLVLYANAPLITLSCSCSLLDSSHSLLDRTLCLPLPLPLSLSLSLSLSFSLSLYLSLFLSFFLSLFSPASHICETNQKNTSFWLGYVSGSQAEEEEWIV